MRCECPQLDAGVVCGCEDCLHLNVYTPKVDSNSSYPVMVYAHGGAYINGNNSISSAGPEFLLDKEVVYVIFNYRLSVLGFLSTGDDAAPGNYGLKDQLLALQWVKKHINDFGGNPKEVTFFGQGAGSASVNLHILASKSRDLYKNAILQSGNALTSQAIALQPSYYEKAKEVAELLNCTTNDSHKMVDCLRDVNVTEIMKVSLRVFDEIDIAMQTTWRPTVEPKLPDAFLTDTPENLIQNKQWNKCPLITGNVRDEGTYFGESLLKYPKLYELCRNEPVRVIERFLQKYPPLDGMNVTGIAVKAKDYYLGKELPDSKNETIARYVNFATDFSYLFPWLQILTYLQQNEPNISYPYQFDYRGTISPAMIFGGELGKTGVGHGSDLYSEFPKSGAYIAPEYSSLTRSEKDYEIVEIFIDLWESFANNSVPVSNKLKNPNLWQPQGNSTSHLKIGNGVSTDVTVETKYSSRVEFWFQNVPQYCLD